MGKWITLVPDKELLFDVAKFEGEKVGDRSTSVDMKIQNNDPARQVFIKIKTTKPSNYHVKPSAVAIEPGASATIKVAFLEKAFLSGTAAVKAKKEDKFLVQAMGETEAVREQNLLEAARKNAILKLEAAQKVAEAAAQKEVDEAGDPQEKEAAQKKKAALSLGKVGDPEEKDVMGELWSLLDKLPEVSKDKLMCRTVGKYSELGNMGGAIRGVCETAPARGIVFAYRLPHDKPNPLYCNTRANKRWPPLLLHRRYNRSPKKRRLPRRLLFLVLLRPSKRTRPRQTMQQSERRPRRQECLWLEHRQRQLLWQSSSHRGVSRTRSSRRPNQRPSRRAALGTLPGRPAKARQHHPSSSSSSFSCSASSWANL
mmetsp:Transcript_33609/g.101561  ORF Transcript_33609/g.101561 Transcript_33609/m.101561 type:complete len:370 (-) Transcript_33609:139-1248(-)